MTKAPIRQEPEKIQDNFEIKLPLNYKYMMCI